MCDQNFESMGLKKYKNKKSYKIFWQINAEIFSTNSERCSEMWESETGGNASLA